MNSMSQQNHSPIAKKSNRPPDSPDKEVKYRVSYVDHVKKHK